MIKAIQVDEFYFHENGTKKYELQFAGIPNEVVATEKEVYNLLSKADSAHYDCGMIIIHCGRLVIFVHDPEN